MYVVIYVEVKNGIVIVLFIELEISNQLLLVNEFEEGGGGDEGSVDGNQEGEFDLIFVDGEEDNESEDMLVMNNDKGKDKGYGKDKKKEVVNVLGCL